MGQKMTEPVDPALLQLVAERMNLSQAEIAALEQGDISSVITSRFAGDPAMVPLLRMAEQQREEANALATVPAAKPKRKQDKKSARMLRMMHHLQEELEATQVVMHHVGKMLGACPYCFGEDEDCEACAGRGAPGSTKPAKKELLAWVEPALARLGLQVTAVQEPALANPNKATTE
jgi:hypothetical protein